MIKKLLFSFLWLYALNIHAQNINACADSTINTESISIQSGGNVYHQLNYSIFSVPVKDLIVIQKKNLNTENTDVELLNKKGKVIQKVILYQGSTIAFFDTKILYDGVYTVKISDGEIPITQKITIIK